MKRVCTACNQQKTLNEFFVKDKLKNKYHTQCKVCYSEKRKHYIKEHYEKYGDEYRLRARVRKEKIKEDNINKIFEYIGDRGCEYCGINDIRVLEFDHIDSETKSFSISTGVRNGYPWSKILLELNKCRILCANCHKIRTAEQQNWRKWRLGRVVRQSSAKARTPVQIR